MFDGISVTLLIAGALVISLACMSALIFGLGKLYDFLQVTALPGLMRNLKHREESTLAPLNTTPPLAIENTPVVMDQEIVEVGETVKNNKPVLKLPFPAMKKKPVEHKAPLSDLFS